MSALDRVLTVTLCGLLTVASASVASLELLLSKITPILLELLLDVSEVLVILLTLIEPWLKSTSWWWLVSVLVETSSVLVTEISSVVKVSLLEVSSW